MHLLLMYLGRMVWKLELISFIEVYTKVGLQRMNHVGTNVIFVETCNKDR